MSQFYIFVAILLQLLSVTMIKVNQDTVVQFARNVNENEIFMDQKLLYYTLYNDTNATSFFKFHTGPTHSISKLSEHFGFFDSCNHSNDRLANEDQITEQYPEYEIFGYSPIYVMKTRCSVDYDYSYFDDSILIYVTVSEIILLVCIFGLLFVDITKLEQKKKAFNIFMFSLYTCYYLLIGIFISIAVYVSIDYDMRFHGKYFHTKIYIYYVMTLNIICMLVSLISLSNYSVRGLYKLSIKQII
jgi:hypothetical protein